MLPEKELESKIAFLERHVEEQDKVILSLRKEIDLIAQQVANLKHTIHDSQSLSDAPIDEKPPHY